ncbi:hypothetical protein [Yeosuana sp.]|uniref:hypothetical protein n=1 Tax=Yeosuana sp. TaxID=2529388 RepID=UPI004055072E|tara:strand:+ start:3347 stop:3937 length:591 start_codon:yes stop_codon:yes gene_type:complete
MNTEVMKKEKFYANIWQVYPLSLDMYRFDSKGRYIKDLVLNNNYATKMNVSEMNLSIINLSAFDLDGNEHFVTDFKGKNLLKIKGLFGGDFLKSTSVLKLGLGTYNTLRFYLGKQGNSFVYSDRREEIVTEFEFLDFNIENGLNIKGNESPEVILRFDFTPYERINYFKVIAQLFEKSRNFTGKLVDNLGHLMVKG